MSDPDAHRRFARRCRELMSRTTIERVREHLDLMAAELEAQAEAAERELRATVSGQSGGG